MAKLNLVAPSVFAEELDKLAFTELLVFKS
mgnify:CR=1 FL=1